MRDLVIVDTGVGNLRSVERSVKRALRESGLGDRSVTLSADPDAVRACAVAVMPGQGAFRDCATALWRNDGALASALVRRIEDGGAYLGICLGLQVLFDDSEEAPGARGLGVLRGSVKRLREGLSEVDGVRAKVPHMGWNLVSPTGAGARWIAPDDYYYFVHSYAAAPREPSVVAATSEHGEPFVCAVAREKLLGVQFHPEKSQDVGIALLRRYFREVLT